MIGFAALWIAALLLIGGFALDRVLTAPIVDNFDTQLDYLLNAMIASSEIGPDGEVRFNRPPADQRFVEPYSGLYFQISGAGADTFPSRSLWDRRLRVVDTHVDVKPHLYDSDEFSTPATRAAADRRARRDPARLAGPLALPGRAVARDARRPDPNAALDLVLELHRARRRPDHPRRAADVLRPVAAAPRAARSRGDPLGRRRPASAPISRAEIRPLTEEINQLLAHSEAQAEEARRHAGNLAHALKTPLTVITNAATAHAPDLADTVCREALLMRRQVDHHLARARAIGRRASAQARARGVGEPRGGRSARSTGCTKMSRSTSPAITQAEVRVERQDLDEMLGNLVENAAKYGGGRVFVTVEREQGFKVDILVEDDGPGIPEESARRSSTAAPGSTPRASPEPASASPSCATSRKSTAGASRSRKARIWAGCWRG